MNTQTRSQAAGARHYTYQSVPASVAAYCERVGEAMSAKRGDVLTRQGERALRCYYVRSGYGKVVSISPAGHQILVGFVGPLDVIGQAAARTWTDSYLVTTIAAQRMELVTWTRESALELVTRFPEVQARLNALLKRNLKVMRTRLHTVSEGRVPRRLAAVLLELADRHGTADELGVAIGPRVTREDLAALTGASLFTVSRILAEWEEGGVLRTRRGRVRLTNVARLRILAQEKSSTRTHHC
jgi:CRP/FNR family transcriptional regulator, nitrogen oxide reductase regulator